MSRGIGERDERERSTDQRERRREIFNDLKRGVVRVWTGCKLHTVWFANITSRKSL